MAALQCRRCSKIAHKYADVPGFWRHAETSLARQDLLSGNANPNPFSIATLFAETPCAESTPWHMPCFPLTVV